MRFWFSLLLGACLLWPTLAPAEDTAPMSIPELARRAQLIVRGKVESRSCLRDKEGRIYTEIKLAPQEVWKGDPKSPLLTVVHGGGILGEEKVTARGQVSYEVGEEVVGFFVWNERGEAVTLSMDQGKFHVNRKAPGAEAFSPYHGRHDERLAASGAKPLGLDELKAAIREASK